MKSALMPSAARPHRSARVITSTPFAGQADETEVRYLGDVSHFDHLLSA
jgi:hypothetical protein